MKNDKIDIKKLHDLGNATIVLPASKSISNRVLIINSLADSPKQIHNLSTARDTQTMLRLLASDEAVLDVIDAGTTMRFLTAYLSVTNQQKILTGTDRMCQRPIGILVVALAELGTSISYQEKKGFPPLKIDGLKTQKTNEIAIRGDVSSQYISALLMIAPCLPYGLKLTLKGNVGSKPYITMTLNIMKQFGVKSIWNDNTISIPAQKYQSIETTIEPDWSGASYWFSIVAMCKSGSVFIKDLKKESLQGDIAVVEMMGQLGVKTEFKDDGALLTKKTHVNHVQFDFVDCPDLAQTIAVTCAAKGISCKMTGLESLKIKETDRVLALQQELLKLGAQLTESSGLWKVIPATKTPEQISIATYDDHRMAMAFAPLATLTNITIEAPDVINKSYPSFWEDMKKVGFELG